MAANAGTISTALSVGSTLYGGLRAYQGSKAEAASLKQKGDNELAVAQRDAMRKRRETDLLLSRQRAVASSSGGGATDPTVLSVMGKTQQEGDYNAMLDMYNGLTSRADLYKEAATVRSEGKSKLVGSILDAGGTLYSDLARRRREARESSPYSMAPSQA